ncbi:hypothetical protein os1_18490 [Comamonadaceae bacterium OS-1]|nr:hypothetical protein os1_18490 [Comamonadaceae bacterium OS-1]
MGNGNHFIQAAWIGSGWGKASIKNNKKSKNPDRLREREIWLLDLIQFRKSGLHPFKPDTWDIIANDKKFVRQQRADATFLSRGLIENSLDRTAKEIENGWMRLKKSINEIEKNSSGELNYPDYIDLMRFIALHLHRTDSGILKSVTEINNLILSASNNIQANLAVPLDDTHLFSTLENKQPINRRSEIKLINSRLEAIIEEKATDLITFEQYAWITFHPKFTKTITDNDLTEVDFLLFSEPFIESKKLSKIGIDVIEMENDFLKWMDANTEIIKNIRPQLKITDTKLNSKIYLANEFIRVAASFVCGPLSRNKFFLINKEKSDLNTLLIIWFLNIYPVFAHKCNEQTSVCAMYKNSLRHALKAIDAYDDLIPE